jgi:hypothetical protein
MSITLRKTQLTICLLFLVLWIYLFSFSLSTVLGNGSSGGSALPIFLSGLTSKDQQFWIGKLKPHLKWYDHFLIVSAIQVSDYHDSREIITGSSYACGSNAKYREDTCSDLVRRNQMFNPCTFKGKSGLWEASLPTRSFFGIYYKNFLVGCSYADFSSYQGFGKNFPRDEQNSINYEQDYEKNI